MKRKSRRPLEELGLSFERLAEEGYMALFHRQQKPKAIFLKISSGQGVMRRVLRADDPKRELALELTMVVTGAVAHEVDKPDGNLERMAFEWYAENEILIAETILSGADEW